MSNRINGTVKWFSGQKGYGFISDDNDADYFAHHTELPLDANPKQGDKVTFIPMEGAKGTKATEVKIV